jgi:hypothetical protein
MHLKDPTPLGLRELRLGAVERLVNKPDIRAEILGHIDEEAPDVFEPFAEITVTGATQTGLRIHIKAGGAFAGTHGGGTVKLERPAGRRLGPDFYRDVLRARDEAETNGQHVLRTLQEATGAPRETVRRWLKEARKLETDSKGKRG